MAGPFAAQDTNNIVRFLLFLLVDLMMCWPAALRAQIESRGRTEQALRTSEERYRTVTETAADAILTIDETSTILLANASTEKIFGHPVDQLIGQKLTLLMPDYLRRVHEESLRRYVTTGQRHLSWQAVELPGLHMSGREIPLEISFAEFKKDGRHFFTGIVRDASERKQAEEALRCTEKLAVVGRLAATIAHEIKNPLDSIAGVLHLLRHQGRFDERTQDYLNLAQEESTRIAQIAENTLGFYRESSAPVPVNLCEVLDNVVRLYEQKIRFDDIQIHKRYDYTRDIQAFPGEMRQLFSNLMRNALEAVRQGGKIQLHVFASRDWSTPEKRGVRVVIGDDGMGISVPDRKRIFDPFFSTKAEKGTGLGLWITRGIVHKHGGAIRVRSKVQPGRSGTCFSVFLPCDTAQSAKVPRRTRA
jgi:two-component system CheB/CheR fusion protein